MKMKQLMLLILLIVRFTSVSFAYDRLLFYASYDSSLNATVSQGDYLVYGASIGSLSTANEGRFGRSLVITKGDSVKYKIDKNYNPSSGTISLWIKPDFDLSEGLNLYLFSALGKDWNDRLDLKIGEYLYFSSLKKENQIMDECTWYIRESLWKSKPWHLVTVTWDSTEENLYFDGMLKDHRYHKGFPLELMGFFTIGSNQNNMFHFTGEVDDVFILDFPFTENQLRQYYQSGLAIQDFLNKTDLSEAVDLEKTAVKLSQSAMLHDKGLAAINIRVKANGLYRIPLQDMKKYLPGEDSNVTQSLLMRLDGHPIPINLYQRDKELITPGDYLEFVCDSYQEESQESSCFTLTWNESTSYHYSIISTNDRLRLTTQQNQFRDSLYLEENNFFRDFRSREDNSTDSWFWVNLTAPSKKQIFFNLQSPIQDSYNPIKIEIGLQGYSYPAVNPDHHVIIRLNGSKIGDAWWDGRSEFIFSTDSISYSIISSGLNSIEFESPGDIDLSKKKSSAMDVSFLNWIRILWNRKLELDRNHSSIVLSIPAVNNGEDLSLKIKSGLKGHIDLFIPSEGIIITAKMTGNAIDSSQPIYNYTCDIPARFLKKDFHGVLCFEEYSYSEIAYSLNPVPADDLLRISNKYDYVIITHPDFYLASRKLANYRAGKGLKTLVVPVDSVYLEFNEGIKNPLAIKKFISYSQDSWSLAPKYYVLMGDASMDPLDYAQKGSMDYIPAWEWKRKYTYRCGTDQKYLQDYLETTTGRNPYIGRLPADSVQDADVMVEKIINYEEDKANDDSWRRHILLIGGIESMFHQNSEELDKEYLKGYDVSKIYMEDNSITGNIDTSRRNQLQQYFNGGLGLIHYTGHGGGGIWADKELFLLEDIKQLNNAKRLPFVISMTCYSGTFDSPFYESLGEELLRKKNGGVIAFFGAATLSSAFDNFQFSKSIFNSIFNKKKRILGDIFYDARCNLKAIQHSNMENADVYNLLGDPALQIKL